MNHLPRRAASLLLALMLTLLPALAAEQTGELTIRCAVERDGETDCLSGDRFDLLLVAEAEVEWAGGTAGLSFRTVEAFARFDCDWSTLTAQQSRRMAQTLAKAAGSDPDSLAHGVTDERGEVRFSGLQPGLYLALRTRTAPENECYEEEPILVFLPLISPEEVAFSVTAQPKIRWAEPEEPVEPTEPESPTGPQPPTASEPPRQSDGGRAQVRTGDDTALTKYYACGIISGLLFLLLLTAPNRRDEDSERTL